MKRTAAVLGVTIAVVLGGVAVGLFVTQARTKAAASARERTDIARLEGKVQVLVKRVDDLESLVATEASLLHKSLAPTTDCLVRTAEMVDALANLVGQLETPARYGGEPSGLVDFGQSTAEYCMQLREQAR